MRIIGGTIHLGKIDHFVVHFGSDVLKPLCRNDQSRPRTVHTTTTDWAKVTCTSCIEWRHA